MLRRPNILSDFMLITINVIVHLLLVKKQNLCVPTNSRSLSTGKCTKIANDIVTPLKSLSKLDHLIITLPYPLNVRVVMRTKRR